MIKPQNSMTGMDAAESPVRSTTPFIVCIIGAVLYLFLSPPLLDSIGFHYGRENGAPYEKIHPAIYFVLLSFVLFLRGGESMLSVLATIIKQRTASFALLCVYILMCVYVMGRDGIAGNAFLLNGHVTVPMIAIMLSYCPYRICKRSIQILIVFALLNSLIGITEGITKLRLLPFAEDTHFANEDIFRSSALLGHPLGNATFTAVILFAAMSLRLGLAARYAVIVILFSSLVAFGGRTGLFASMLFLIVYAVYEVCKIALSGQVSIRRAVHLGGLTIISPALFLAFMLFLINSTIGERILAYSSFDDSSASSRLGSLEAVEFMTDVEFMFGVPSSRILDITDRMGQKNGIIYIENPWILMLLKMGAIQFTAWLIASLYFIYTISRNTPFVLKLSLVMYVLIASTFNSFGSKDLNYPITIFTFMVFSRYVREGNSNASARPEAEKISFNN